MVPLASLHSHSCVSSGGGGGECTIDSFCRSYQVSHKRQQPKSRGAAPRTDFEKRVHSSRPYTICTCTSLLPWHTTAAAVSSADLLNLSEPAHNHTPFVVKLMHASAMGLILDTQHLTSA